MIAQAAVTGSMVAAEGRPGVLRHEKRTLRRTGNCLWRPIPSLAGRIGSDCLAPRTTGVVPRLSQPASGGSALRFCRPGAARPSGQHHAPACFRDPATRRTRRGNRAFGGRGPGRVGVANAGASRCFVRSRLAALAASAGASKAVWRAKLVLAAADHGPATIGHPGFFVQAAVDVCELRVELPATRRQPSGRGVRECPGLPGDSDAQRSAFQGKRLPGGGASHRAQFWRHRGRQRCSLPSSVSRHLALLCASSRHFSQAAPGLGGRSRDFSGHRRSVASFSRCVAYAGHRSSAP